MLSNSSPSDRLLGLPIEDFTPEAEPDLKKVWRLRCDRVQLEQQLDDFFQSPVAPKCSGLIISTKELLWEESRRIASEKQIEQMAIPRATSSLTPVKLRLIEEAPNLPHLRGLWITPEHGRERTDVSLPDILNAFPGIEEFHLKASRLDSGPFRHICLRKLSIDIGLLQSLFVKSIANCVLPNLEELEIVLGNASTFNQLTHEHFEELKVLRLRSSPIDQVFDWIKQTGLPQRLQVLDISYGRNSEEYHFSEMLPHFNQLERLIANCVFSYSPEYTNSFKNTFENDPSFSFESNELRDPGVGGGLRTAQTSYYD